MEISGPTIGIFYISRVLGLAPYSIKPRVKGGYEIKSSWFFTLYSLSLSIVMVTLTYHALFSDSDSKIPVRASFRMKSAIAKVVTTLDISLVVMGVMSGVLCGLLGGNATRELNKRLRKFDDSLISFANAKEDRLRALLTFLLPITFTSFLLGLDVGTWQRFADDIKPENKNAKLNIEWYIPFDSMYYILIILHIYFANTAFGLHRRFRRLNLMLHSSFLSEEDDAKNDKKSKPNITTVKSIQKEFLTLNRSLTKLSANDIVYKEVSVVKKQSYQVRQLAEQYENLEKSVAIVSNSYGISVLIILTSCLLHLVATAYFLFLELFSKKDDSYLWLQVMWVFLHVLRLLMVVEPCHLATTESKKTIKIVCEIERKMYDPILAEEIKKFWQQLLVSDIQFSAIGMCNVNRTILTAYSSAIATYLVILIQFQKTD